MPDAQAVTKRDEWSLTFEDVINLDEMRQDCPITLPDIPDGYSNIHPSLHYGKGKRGKGGKHKKNGIREHTWWMPGKQATNDFQRSILAAASPLCNLELKDMDKYLVDQATCGQFLIDCMKDFINSAE